MQSPQAVIEIGSTGIRLLIAEIVDSNSLSLKSQKQRNILDRSEVSVNLGRDVFTTGSISRETLISCINILNRFAEQISAWGIKKEETTVVATSAVREAVNRDPFVDRIKVKTGFTIRVIDGIEENRLMYIAVSECLKDENVSVRQSNSIILDITGGATEMMLMEKGQMAGAHSLRLGTVIIEQQIKSMLGTMEDAQRFVEEFIRNTKNSLNSEINLDKIKQFIALGTNMKIAAIFAGKPISPFLWEIDRDDFIKFVDKLLHYTLEEVTARFKIRYNDAQEFQISLLTYKGFLEVTKVNTIIVPDTTLREGVIYSQMDKNNEELQQEFNAQITASANNLLRKYQGDEKHAECVRQICLKLYDALEEELEKDNHMRMLLEVSAILHDIGMFIRAKDHNIHSSYIILNSEIFGLSHDDVALIAAIAKFHKGTRFPHEDAAVRLLSRSSRMTILKLSAILRLADALDRSHRQTLKNFTLGISQDTVTIRAKNHSNITLEQLAVKEKGDLFESVFGYKIVLI